MKLYKTSLRIQLQHSRGDGQLKRQIILFLCLHSGLQCEHIRRLIGFFNVLLRYLILDSNPNAGDTDCLMFFTDNC